MLLDFKALPLLKMILKVLLKKTRETQCHLHKVPVYCKWMYPVCLFTFLVSRQSVSCIVVCSS